MSEQPKENSIDRRMLLGAVGAAAAGGMAVEAASSSHLPPWDLDTEPIAFRADGKTELTPISPRIMES
ncbi:MAG TPA: hypothetical protein VH682_11135 [Gemmataceae bacterium]|jgi:hypothetical protein